ncbi:MAG: GNAT family N-acetyltransferase [Vulcanimicrobiaceae bacterium]
MIDAQRLVALRAAQPGSWFLRGFEDERHVGIAYGAPGRDDDGLGRAVRGLLHLSMVAVEPNAWGRGIGSQLVQRSLELGAERGFRRVQLWVQADNVRAQRLYERFGLTRSGRVKRDPRGEPIVHYIGAIGARERMRS